MPLAQITALFSLQSRSLSADDAGAGRRDPCPLEVQFTPLQTHTASVPGARPWCPRGLGSAAGEEQLLQTLGWDQVALGSISVNAAPKLR